MKRDENCYPRKRLTKSYKKKIKKKHEVLRLSLPPSRTRNCCDSGQQEFPELEEEISSALHSHLRSETGKDSGMWTIKRAIANKTKTKNSSWIKKIQKENSQNKLMTRKLANTPVLRRWSRISVILNPVVRLPFDDFYKNTAVFVIISDAIPLLYFSASNVTMNSFCSKAKFRA